MAKIYAPNKAYSGISASVPFVDGIGESDNPALLNWFQEHGYTIEISKNTKSAKPAAQKSSPEETEGAKGQKGATHA